MSSSGPLSRSRPAQAFENLGSVISGSVWLTESVPRNSRITQAKARTQGLLDGDAA